MVDASGAALRRLRQAYENATEGASVAFFYLRILTVVAVGLKDSYEAR